MLPGQLRYTQPHASSPCRSPGPGIGAGAGDGSVLAATAPGHTAGSGFCTGKLLSWTVPLRWGEPLGLLPPPKTQQHPKSSAKMMAGTASGQGACRAPGAMLP